MRVVIDTNVMLVSISDRSPHHWIFQGLIKNKFELCVTTDILLEYEEIIAEHMGRSVSESFLGVLENLPNVELITFFYRFDLIKKDRDDNKFVDCAIASSARFIVSEDKDFNIFKNLDFPKVETVDLREFRKILKENSD